MLTLTEPLQSYSRAWERDVARSRRAVIQRADLIRATLLRSAPTPEKQTALTKRVKSQKPGRPRPPNRIRSEFSAQQCWCITRSPFPVPGAVLFTSSPLKPETRNSGSEGIAHSTPHFWALERLKCLCSLDVLQQTAWPPKPNPHYILLSLGGSEFDHRRASSSFPARRRRYLGVRFIDLYTPLRTFHEHKRANENGTIVTPTLRPAVVCVLQCALGA